MALLEVVNLEKSYGALKAVQGISFSVEKGGLIGFLGPNGAGKSTTISMISTLLKPDAGEILYKGQNIIKQPKKIQRELGIVPQEIALYSTLTGMDNLKFWGQSYGLSGSHLKERIETVSKIIGIQSRLGDKVENYSGGMKRRLNIGAALLHEPELLIMDEPTVGIDPQSRNHILDTVLKLNEEGMTIIYTSHYMEEVEYLCQYINIIDSGQIIASGTQDQLVDSISGDRQIIIQLDHPSEAFVEVVKSLESVQSVDTKKEQVTVHTNNGKRLIKEIIEKTISLEVSVESIEVIKPNLESVFLHLTGKALRD